MNTSRQKARRLNDFVLQKMEEARIIGYAKTPYGMSTAGERLDRWRSLGMHHELLTRYHGFAEFAPTNYIDIRVPVTATGARPNDAEEQPYFWNGMINEYVAEMAVWWAFDLLTPGEAVEFMLAHKPSVQFGYMEGRRRDELSVQFENGLWIVR